MPRQGHGDRTDLEALSARAHQLSTLIAGTSAPGHAAERNVAHLQAELLQIEKMLLILADTSSAAETRTMQEEDLVTIAEAARLLGLPRTRVGYWVRIGRVPLAQTHPRRVSLDAVRRAARAMTPDPSGEYVQPFEAARVVDVPRATVQLWVRTGKVATQPGPYGQLVRLADVQVMAAQREKTGGETKEGS